jgi:hypothetical protein
MLSRARTGPRFGIYQIRDGKIVRSQIFLTPTRARRGARTGNAPRHRGLLTRGAATSPPGEGVAPYFVCPWLLESWKAATSYWLTALGFLACSIPAA